MLQLSRRRSTKPKHLETVPEQLRSYTHQTDSNPLLQDRLGVINLARTLNYPQRMPPVLLVSRVHFRSPDLESLTTQSVFVQSYRGLYKYISDARSGTRLLQNSFAAKSLSLYPKVRKCRERGTGVCNQSLVSASFAKVLQRKLLMSSYFETKIWLVPAGPFPTGVIANMQRSFML